MRSQQVALHPIGEKLQTALPLFTFAHPLLLLAQALCNPSGQGIALDRIELHCDAIGIERHEPGTGFAGLVQARQQHQGQHTIVFGRHLGHALQSHAAFFAGLARRDAHIQQQLVGKQTHGGPSGLHLAPIEMRPSHGEHMAL